jgi:hypothetical protein
MRDPGESELDEGVLEQFLSDPDSFVAQCQHEHWEQEDWSTGKLVFRITYAVGNGDCHVEAVLMETKEDGTPVFPLGDDWVERVESADRSVRAFVCADGSGQHQFAPDEKGPDEIRGMTYFEDAGTFEAFRKLLDRIRERGMQILRRLSH